MEEERAEALQSSLINTKPLARMLLKRSSFRMTQHEAEAVFHVVTTTLRETGKSIQTLSSSEEELYLMPPLTFSSIFIKKNSVKQRV